MPIDREVMEAILKDIQSTGVASEENRTLSVIIASRSHLQHVLNNSSGSPRIRNASKFKLILSQPQSLLAFNPFEIRCCLCTRVISYPCWYHSVRYAVNQFHYFVCFDKNSTNEPTTKCYRKSIGDNHD